ncbi:MAG: hypothetical protein H6741_31880 [Alphaproteobacteria bacterium]|nr:hypothetical protein [Alphaproteobacteria bacterium]
MPDRSREFVSPFHRRRFTFPPFKVEGEGTPLSGLPLADHEELLVFSCGGEERGLNMVQMAYHHVAQGELRGIPYLVVF